MNKPRCSALESPGQPPSPEADPRSNRPCVLLAAPHIPGHPEAAEDLAPAASEPSQGASESPAAKHDIAQPPATPEDESADPVGDGHSDADLARQLAPTPPPADTTERGTRGAPGPGGGAPPAGPH